MQHAKRLSNNRQTYTKRRIRVKWCGGDNDRQKGLQKVQMTMTVLKMLLFDGRLWGMGNGEDSNGRN